MIGVVLVGHGGLANCFVQAIEHVVGPQSQLVAISINPDDDLEAKRQDILKQIKKVDNGEGVIVVTDMFGGTPSNLAMSLLDCSSIDVIAGMNLPMLIKMMSHRQNHTRADVIHSAEEAGKKYIMVASHLMKKGDHA